LTNFQKQKQVNPTVFYIVYVVLIAVLLCIPVLQITALNTIFPILAIPVNIWTYLSICLLNFTWFYKPLVQKVKVVTK